MFFEFKKNINPEHGEKILSVNSDKTLPIVKTPSSCYTDWVNFDEKNWSGLTYGFDQVNGVYSLKDPTKRIDSIAKFNRPCRGGIKVEFQFTPFSKTLLNTNIYFGSWFRWEIGGNDLRSVRLFKNLDGCNAMKEAIIAETLNKFLPPGDKITVEKPVLATMNVFLTDSGKLRTELDLKYVSSLTNKDASYNGKFYYEFDVGWYCNPKTVLDISKDSNEIGVGLQPSNINGAELPRIRFEKLKISSYSPKN